MANPYKNTGKAGSPAHFIGPIGKAFVKGAKAFANTAKQYLNISKGNKKTASNFKPFHRDGKTYSREDINNAFKARFSQYSLGPKMPEAKSFWPTTRNTGDLYSNARKRAELKQQTIRPPKSPSTNFGRADAQVKMREAYKNLDKLK